MTPSDPDIPLPGGEDEALAAALSKRVPVPESVLERLRAEREQLGKEKADPKEQKIIAFPAGVSRPANRQWRTWAAAAAAIAILGVLGYQLQMGRQDGGSSAIVTRSPQGTITTTQPEIA